jgi:hypothetical protein
LQTFAPGTSQDVAVTFTNTTGAPAAGLKLSVATPRGWTAVASGGADTSAPVAPGAAVSATFKVTSGSAAFNGDLVAKATWTNAGKTQSDTAAEKVRNVSPVRINEFRIGAPGNPTNSFIELYNSGARDIDLSNWTLTEHPGQQPIFSTVKIPAGTKLAARGFYLLGLSDSGLAVAARAGDSTIHVRSTAGMSVGDAIDIDGETRKIASIVTTLWQPLPDGPVMTIPAGSTNVPVTSAAGFAVGEKIALGYGATYPAVASGTEKYEVASVTAVGKPGTQALLGADAPADSTNIKVTNVANISPGDRIRLDVASVGHGIETVTVTKVGTAANRTALVADASAGSTNIKVRGAGPGRGAPGVVPFAVGDKMNIGTPANRDTVTITAVGSSGPAGAGIDFTPALAHAHANGEPVVDPGTGLDLAAPLKFSHAANLPFSDRGTGITFGTPTQFAHASNEPVLPLGTGITLDRPLAKAHAIDAPVRDARVTAEGYQGSPAPNQWFGGPALSGAAGAMILRDAAGLVVDSLNYGLLVDPWAAEGYQAASGALQAGCRVAAPGALNRSAGRFPDGADTDSNCGDFVLQPATALSQATGAGATNLKVAGVADFAAGQTVTVDSGANAESGVIAAVGTAGGTTVSADIKPGATAIPVAGAAGFAAGQTISIDSGGNSETAVVVATAGGRGGGTITVGPLTKAHAAGAQVSGSGITLAGALAKAHAAGAQVVSGVPTPGAPNQYYRSGR